MGNREFLSLLDGSIVAYEKHSTNSPSSHGCAWGLFDKDGVKDELGTLNLLTPEVVLKAREEIQTGRSVALNWGLDRLSEEAFGRSTLKHKLVDWRTKPNYPFYCYDDEISFNTQVGEPLPSSRCTRLCSTLFLQIQILMRLLLCTIGSQWDGLRKSF